MLDFSPTILPTPHFTILGRLDYMTRPTQKLALIQFGKEDLSLVQKSTCNVKALGRCVNVVELQIILDSASHTQTTQVRSNH